MSRDVKEWFRNEVHFWRCLRSIAASLALQVLLTPVALILLQFNVFCPFDGFAAWLTSFGDSPWYHACFLGAGFLLAAYQSTCVTVAPVVHRTRLAQMMHLCHPRNLGQAMLRALAGGIFVRALLGILGGSYAQLQRDCIEPSQFECLSEAHVFLVLHGAFTGISLHLAQLAANRMCIAFPPIQVSSVRMRLQIRSTMRWSAWDTFRKAHYFYFLYFVFGAVPKKWIAGDADPTQWVGDLQSVWGLLDLHLFWALMITGAAVRTLDQLAVQLRDYYLTKVHQFPIIAEHEAEKPVRMSAAMASSDCPLLRYLSFLDFRHFAEHSGHRRAQAFAISFPGCHPLHWGALSGVCLELASQFTQALMQLEAPPPPSQPGQPSGTAPGASQVPADYYLRMRSMVAPATPGKNPALVTRPAPSQGPAPQKLSWPNQVLAALKNKPLILHFTSELPDVKSRQLFADCQPLIWAIEGLCLLVCASKKEDKFGVVQFSLPAILNAMLELDQASAACASVLERHSKRCASLRRPNSSSGRELRLARTLKAAVSTGLYQMTTTFKEHIGRFKVRSHVLPDTHL
ncbi:nuclear division cycle 1 isoform X2 [Amblyomma americanum]